MGPLLVSRRSSSHPPAPTGEDSSPPKTTRVPAAAPASSRRSSSDATSSATRSSAVSRCTEAKPEKDPSTVHQLRDSTLAPQLSPRSQSASSLQQNGERPIPRYKRPKVRYPKSDHTKAKYPKLNLMVERPKLNPRVKHPKLGPKAECRSRAAFSNQPSHRCQRKTSSARYHC